jgi:hypothetical protein
MFQSDTHGETWSKLVSKFYDEYQVLTKDILDQIPNRDRINKRELSDNTGIPIRTIRYIFNGYRTYTYLRTADKLCTYLGLDLPEVVFHPLHKFRRGYK